MHIKTMAEFAAEGRDPEVLFWVGCLGSYDARAQRVSAAFAQILDNIGIEFAILGKEESCTGDPARRAGNEFIFQMLANQNIQTLTNYGVKKVVTTCPHCFNIFKNEYPELGATFEVFHHTQFLSQLLQDKRLKIEGGSFDGQRITYHDSCYLGRINGEYEAPRELIHALDVDLVEMGRSREKGLCCGAGGAQMFKEDEPGEKRINTERAEEAINTGASIVAVNCSFCNVMMTDGLKAKEKQDEVKVMDVAEMIWESMKPKN
ncbi:MAG TPA: (Fe-S)-binding protein [Saprospiraceae bacterium]|jgi:Fe-S oxidoreductase|nr:MAG: CoB--CoM heterodisulfide reductase [Candidatus Parvibacillus calidus]MBX2936709.1 (Fe-S)-binding protein [Saprospiraceae bacterium]MCC7149742.1 (Fe-S)-binding protein [Saprospiraceae bacterium]MCO5282802.1 (Fe-S)-binding protein [Saprospiraceae bacterium]MCO6470514.1 (Fe-S)-binding protein [Saprospiraceae bacterium]